jgi:hypothetical protein
MNRHFIEHFTGTVFRSKATCISKNTKREIQGKAPGFRKRKVPIQSAYKCTYFRGVTTVSRSNPETP